MERGTSGTIQAPPAGRPSHGAALEVLRVFARLGLTCFGGPVAHIGCFRAEFVDRRRWLDERAFADLVALCQFLPGPASSQTGFAIGLMRGGWLGGLAAWAGFTLPSAACLVLFACGTEPIARSGTGGGLLHGLKLVAVAVVAQAVSGMARSLCPDRTRASIATLAAACALAAPSSVGQVGAIAGGCLAGLALCGAPELPEVARGTGSAAPASRRVAFVCLASFAALLAASFAGDALGSGAALFDAFYRSGALVFGGGHVVLPLLKDAVVAPGWVDEDAFLAGYGAAQATPGPLFAFAAFLGAVMRGPAGGLLGAAVALVAIFLPGLLLVTGVLPFWDGVRAAPRAQAALRGANAAVVGLLGAAFYDPVWTSAVLRPADLIVALAGFVLLVAWRAPPLLVVILGAMAGAGLGA